MIAHIMRLLALNIHPGSRHIWLYTSNDEFKRGLDVAYYMEFFDTYCGGAERLIESIARRARHDAINN